MNIIFGIGNKGHNYALTRHNVGILFGEYLSKQPNCKIYLTNTYMNLSGKFVKNICLKN